MDLFAFPSSYSPTLIQLKLFRSLDDSLISKTLEIEEITYEILQTVLKQAIENSPQVQQLSSIKMGLVEYSSQYF